MITRKPRREKRRTPSPTPAEVNREVWIFGEQPTETATIRFTIDLPVDLHTRMKTQCVARRVKMKEVIQRLLEQAFPLDAGSQS